MTTDKTPATLAVDVLADLIAAAESFAALLFDPSSVEGMIELEIDPLDVARLQNALARVKGESA